MSSPKFNAGDRVIHPWQMGDVYEIMSVDVLYDPNGGPDRYFYDYVNLKYGTVQRCVEGPILEIWAVLVGSVNTSTIKYKIGDMVVNNYDKNKYKIMAKASGDCHELKNIGNGLLHFELDERINSNYDLLYSEEFEPVSKNPPNAHKTCSCTHNFLHKGCDCGATKKYVDKWAQ